MPGTPKLLIDFANSFELQERLKRAEIKKNPRKILNLKYIPWAL